MTFPSTRLRDIQKANRRVWFYRPSLSWYWYGWAGLSPVSYGHDEYSQITLCLGWSFTGYAVIALRPCGDLGCYNQTLHYIDENEKRNND